MSKKLKVLIVEDDKKFGESLMRLLNAEGFDCIHADKPQAALAFCKLHSFDLAVVDCMLPQMNGVDLALKLKEITSGSMVVYLMSGIYKDKNFSIQALKKSGAKSFLIKPFDFQDFMVQVNLVRDEKKTEPLVSENPVKNLLIQENLTQNIVITALKELENINGYEIPFIFNLLLTYKCQGVLTLKTEKNFFQLIFSDQKVSAQPPKMDPVQLKTALLNREVVIPEDIAPVSDNEFNIDFLLRSNLVSPHHLETIQKEILTDALATLVANEAIQLNWNQDAIPHAHTLFTQKEVDEQIYNWVTNTQVAWLKAYYMPYHDFVIRKMNTQQNKSQFFPLVMANKPAVALLLQNKNMAEFLAESKLNDDTAFKLLHLMMVYREFFIGSRKAAANVKAQVDRMKSLIVSFEVQNAFERLGLTEKATDQEIKKAYTDLSQTLHPDKLADATEEVKILSFKVYEKIQEAYNQIKSPDKRDQYMKIIEVQKHEKMLKANKLIDEAMNLLLKGDMAPAETLLLQAQELYANSTRLKLLMAWCLLKQRKTQGPMVMRTLQSVSQDEKETALYYHVRGLLNLSSRDLEKAALMFKSALTKDPQFMPSRRELSLIASAPSKKEPPQSIFNADLKHVIGMFFNKKK